jgi:VWFA-related protein
VIGLAAVVGLHAGEEEPVVFRSDVSLVRVDVRVAGHGNRAVTGLSAQDFVLRDNGKIQPIRNFASEEMPLDVVLLIDVSGSMQSHVERLASASGNALASLADADRVAVMVFDRATRLRVPLTNNLESVERDLRSLIRSEGFNGGTDITRALLDAARHIGKSSRRDARRAIVILTDDQTERERDELRVGRALDEADAVLSALIAPNAMRSHVPGGGYPPSGGWGDIIFGPRRPTGGGYPIPGGRGRSRTHSAGTSEIALASGGDSLPVDHASALRETLDGIRQRYSLYFQVPGDAKEGEQRQLRVELTGAAQRRMADARLTYRSEYRAPGGTGSTPGETPETQVVSQVPSENVPMPAGTGETSEPKLRRRPVNEAHGPRGPNVFAGAGSSDAAAPNTERSGPAASSDATGGWRRATEEEIRQAKAAEETATLGKKQ